MVVGRRQKCAREWAKRRSTCTMHGVKIAEECECDSKRAVYSWGHGVTAERDTAVLTVPSPGVVVGDVLRRAVVVIDRRRGRARAAVELGGPGVGLHADGDVIPPDLPGAEAEAIGGADHKALPGELIHPGPTAVVLVLMRDRGAVPVPTVEDLLLAEPLEAAVDWKKSA